MRAGGPRARGRRAASWAEWASIREQVLARAGWRCQACRVRRRLDVHHVVKRSQGGSDFDLDLLVALCRWCHDQTDAPYERGRLVVTALGAGQFTFEVVQRAGRGTRFGRVPTFAHGGKIHPSKMTVTRSCSSACVLPMGAKRRRKSCRSPPSPNRQRVGV